jgi:hypothetical protein
MNGPSVPRHPSAFLRSCIRPLCGALAAGTLVAMAIGASTVSSAQARRPEAARQACGEHTIRGTYGFTVSGTRTLGAAGTETVIGTGIVVYDGAGGLRIVDNVHGSISGASRDRYVEGVYEVANNCTGRATLLLPEVPVPIETSFVVVDGGKEIREAVMSPLPAMITTTARRL